MIARRGRHAGWLGWLLIGASVILVVLMQPLGEVGGVIYFQGALAAAPTESIDVRRLPFFEGRNRGNGVYALHYQFKTPDGRRHTGVSYIADGEMGGANRSVVQYRVGLPHISRLQGHRLTPFGPLGLVALAPGLVGVLLLRSRAARQTRIAQAGPSPNEG